MTSGFEIMPLDALDPADVVDVINAAFGKQESLDWYQWKHRDGPWGPSIGVGAVDEHGLIGVRLLLPWTIAGRDGTTRAYRATEAATVPRAQGRGVFSALNRWMMETLPGDLLFSTPNHLSRGGYLKLGWQQIAQVPHLWEVLPARRGPSAPRTTADVLRTPWDRPSLRWRADPRCRHRYTVLEDGEVGLVYREVRRRGVRGVAPLAHFGTDLPDPDLWREMLGRERARFLLRPASQPSPWVTHRRVTRGSSLLVAWLPPEWSPAAFENAPWTQADLEAVI